MRILCLERDKILLKSGNGFLRIREDSMVLTIPNLLHQVCELLSANCAFSLDHVLIKVALAMHVHLTVLIL